MRHASAFSSLISSFLLPIFFNGASGQVTLTYQNGVAGDPWTYTSSGASALAQAEVTSPQNYVSGPSSIVAGGNTGGGNCWAGGSGNGPAAARQFTFSSVDISSSNESVRTLTFNWGNRYPVCNGTGWDAGENLTFTPYIDGSPQAPVTLATGNNNAAFNIDNNQFTYSIPACVNQFYFVVSVTTNRADELLFLDDVRITAPQLNASSAQPSVIAGPISVCSGSLENYSVTAVPGTIYTWSGLPGGAQFTSANGTVFAHSIGVDWGTAAPGTYTLTVTPSNACGATGIPQTLNVTVESAPAPVTISGPTTMCPGETIVLSSGAASGNSWLPNGETTQTISVTGPGTYTVTVSGTCGTVTDSYAVSYGAGPAVQSADATDVSCFGMSDGTLTVNATGASLEYSLDGITWQTGNVFTGLPPGLYDIGVREAGGCQSSIGAVISEPQELTAAASNDGPYCVGEAIQLHGTTTASGVSWNWTGPGGYTSSVQDPADAALAGTYTLFIAENGCVSQTVTTEVIAGAIPQTAASNTGAYCAGDAIQLNGSSDIPADSWQWSGPNGYTSSVEDPTDATEAGIYTLTAAANGCSSQPVTTTVEINAVPDAAATYNAPFCAGNMLQLYGSSTTPGALSWLWSGPGGYTSSLEDPTDATEAGYYTLIVSLNGCSGPAAAVNVVSASPAVNASNAGPYCEGDDVQLSGSADTGAAYSWNGPNGYTSLQEDPADATEGGIYTLTVTTNGCSASASTVVTVFPLPTADMTSDQGCSPEPVAFQSSAIAAQPQQIVTWNWNFGDGETSSEANPDHIYENAGTYMVTLEVFTNMGCSSSVTEPVNIDPAPQADFHFSPNAISDLDPTIQFINTSTGADQYFWLMGEGIEHTTEASPTVIFPTGQGASYTVTLIAYSLNGCADSMTQTIPVEQSVVYYIPNAFTPDGDEYNNTFRPVFTQGHDPENYTLAIYNRWGEVIFESHDVDQGWDGTYQGTLSQEGAYTWSIHFKHRNDDAWERISGHVSLLR